MSARVRKRDGSRGFNFARESFDEFHFTGAVGRPVVAKDFVKPDRGFAVDVWTTP